MVVDPQVEFERDLVLEAWSKLPDPAISDRAHVTLVELLPGTDPIEWQHIQLFRRGQKLAIASWDLVEVEGRDQADPEYGAFLATQWKRLQQRARSMLANRMNHDENHLLFGREPWEGLRQHLNIYAWDNKEEFGLTCTLEYKVRRHTVWGWADSPQ